MSVQTEVFRARPLRIGRGALLLLLVAAVGGAALLFALNGLRGNFHAVVPGHLFRSAMLDGETLRRTLRDEGIRTVINLRGPHPDEAWWREEKQMTGEAGAALVDLPWPDNRMLSMQEIRRFLDVAQSAREPVLIHCDTGIDKTGLAAALYLAFRLHSDEATAERQMSVLYGHIALPFFPGRAMDRTFESLEPFLGYSSS